MENSSNLFWSGSLNRNSYRRILWVLRPIRSAALNMESILATFNSFLEGFLFCAKSKTGSPENSEMKRRNEMIKGWGSVWWRLICFAVSADIPRISWGKGKEWGERIFIHTSHGDHRGHGEACFLLSYFLTLSPVTVSRSHALTKNKSLAPYFQALHYENLLPFLFKVPGVYFTRDDANYFWQCPWSQTSTCVCLCRG